MEHENNLANQISNMFLMLSFHEMDNAVWDAFQEGDTEMVAKCSDLYKILISDVCKFVPSDNV